VLLYFGAHFAIGTVCTCCSDQVTVQTCWKKRLTL